MPNRKFDRNDPNITARYSSGDYPLSSETFIRKIPGSQPWYLPDDTETVVINYSTPDRQYYQGNTPVEADTVRTRYTHNPYPFFRSTQLVGNTTHTSPVMRQPVKPMLNYQHKFQQGGQLNMDEQQLQQQIVQLVQMAMQGDQQATKLIEQIMQAAQQGDQLAMQLAQMIQQVAQQLQSQQQEQVRAAKFGAKLDYIKQLRGQCPEGYEMQYYKQGGQLCKKCMKKAQEGTKVQTPKNAVDAFKCGRKMKKNKCGGNVDKKQNGGQRVTVTPYPDPEGSLGWGMLVTARRNQPQPRR